MPNILTESKFASYYDHNVLLKDLNFQLLETSQAGIDNLSGKFLKDGAYVLAQPISQFCNFSIKLNSFPRS